MFGKHGRRIVNRFEFRKRFKTVGPAVLPVIHARDRGQVVRNVQIAVREGAHGVFLINHDFALEGLLPLVREVRNRYPALWLGVNFLGVTGARAFPVLGELARSGCVVDVYWADDARTDERADAQPEADAIAKARWASGWSGLYLGGTAFKKQREVRPEHFETAARIATRYMDAVTTSGAATGRSAEVSKIRAFRNGCEEQALAVASGVTPDNASGYAALVDAILVATGINRCGDFYNIEEQEQCNRKTMDHFASFDPTCYFPETPLGACAAERFCRRSMDSRNQFFCPNIRILFSDPRSGHSFALMVWCCPTRIFCGADS